MHASTETGRLLHDDHRRTIDVLSRIDGFLAATDDARIVAVDSAECSAFLGDLSHLLADEIGSHFDFEEQAIFPMLEARGAYALIGMLAEDHARLRPLGRRVAALCALARRDGFEAETWLAFRAFAGDLAESLLRHLEVEETTMLAMIDRILDPTTDRAFAAAYRDRRPVT